MKTCDGGYLRKPGYNITSKLQQINLNQFNITIKMKEFYFIF
jgi:hypothetical protein